MIVQHLLLTMAWIVYCILHSVMAATGVKNYLRLQLKTSYKYYRLFYTLFAFIGLATLLYLHFTISPVELFLSQGLVRIAGFFITIAGAILMLYCIRHYFFSLSGIRSLVQEDQESRLIITGVHRYVRHPLYLGTFVFIWGLLFLIPQLSLLLANVVITVYTLIGMRLEESKLVEEFGEEYKNYQRSVPALIPFKKPRREFL